MTRQEHRQELQPAYMNAALNVNPGFAGIRCTAFGHASDWCRRFAQQRAARFRTELSTPFRAGSITAPFLSSQRHPKRVCHIRHARGAAL